MPAEQRSSILQRRLHNSGSFAARVATLASGTVFAQGITILAAPVLTRLYSPGQLGGVAALMAVVSALGVIAAGRYDMAIVLPKRDTDAFSLFLLGLMISAGLAAVVLFVFGFFGQGLAPILGMEDLEEHWILLIAPLVFLVGTEHILTRFNIRMRRFRAIAITQVAQQTVANGTKIGTGLAGLGVTGLMIATVASYLGRVGGLATGIWKPIQSNGFRFDWRHIAHLARRYRKFPLVSSWSAFATTASTQLPVILFSALFSPAVAGFYSLSHRVLKLPMTFIGQNVGQVFLERAARSRDNPAELRRITLALYQRLLAIGLLSLSLVFFYAPTLFGFVFGDAWTTAGQFARWMSLWLVFHFVYSPMSTLYTVLERQGEGLIWNTILLVLRTLAVVVGAIILESPMNTMIVFSLVGAVLYASRIVRLLVLGGVRPKETLVSFLRIGGPIVAAQSGIYLLVNRVWLS